MKILHTADLHLGSKMQTSLSPEKARERKEELMSAFKRMTEYAAREGIDAFILAGDIFDSGRTPKKTIDYFLSCIGNCPTVDFYCICGNHDKECFDKMGELPENLKIFGDGWQTFTKENVAFTGRNTVTADMYSGLTLDTSHFNIVILHGSAKPSGTHEGDSVVLSLLGDKNIDYLALGHIHSFGTMPLGEKGIACYPGCPEGRGFDECGDKGFVMIDTEAARDKRTSFVSVCGRRLHKVNAEIDQNDLKLADIEKKIEREVQGIPETDMVEVVLEGYSASDAEKDITALSQTLKRFYFARIKDCTTLYINENDYLGDITLKGSFMRIISDLKAAEEDSFLRDIAECGIRALRGEDIE